MSNLLKEAIADAKAVRETALENAKAALEEAFTPRLQSMLSQKLKEDEYEESDDEVTEEDDEEKPLDVDVEDAPESGDEGEADVQDPERGGEPLAVELLALFFFAYFPSLLSLISLP